MYNLEQAYFLAFLKYFKLLIANPSMQGNVRSTDWLFPYEQ